MDREQAGLCEKSQAERAVEQAVLVCRQSQEAEAAAGEAAAEQAYGEASYDSYSNGRLFTATAGRGCSSIMSQGVFCGTLFTCTVNRAILLQYIL